MLLLRLLFLILICLAIALVITQVILPALDGTRFFPAFRKDPLKDKKEKLEDLRDKLSGAYLQAEEVQLKEKIKEVKSTTKE